MSQFVGGNLCWRFLRKFTFGGFYFGDFLHLQELGVARVNNQLLLADFILAIYLSTANPPTLIPRQQIDSYGRVVQLHLSWRILHQSPINDISC